MKIVLTNREQTFLRQLDARLPLRAKIAWRGLANAPIAHRQHVVGQLRFDDVSNVLISDCLVEFPRARLVGRRRLVWIARRLLKVQAKVDLDSAIYFSGTRDETP